MTQAASLERKKIQASLFAILGQDSQHYTHEEEGYDDGYYMEENVETEELGFESYEDDGVYYHNEEEADEWPHGDFDTDQAYQGDYEAEPYDGRKKAGEAVFKYNKPPSKTSDPKGRAKSAMALLHV